MSLQEIKSINETFDAITQRCGWISLTVVFSYGIKFPKYHLNQKDENLNALKFQSVKPDLYEIWWPNTIRYDTRCYINVRSTANMSQLNLPHGADN